MKAFHCFLKSGCRLVLPLLTLATGAAVSAQTNTASVPTVTIRATDPFAAGPGDPGAFMVFRAGGTNADLNVYYNIGGTASNGVDYAQIPNWVLLPAGATASTIIITPTVNRALAVTQTVRLQLAWPPTLNPVNYLIGSPSNATVSILPPVPPLVSLVNPTNNQVFHTPVSIPLLARVTDPDTWVTNVEFFAGANDLGRGLPLVVDPLAGPGISGLVYWLNWQNVPTNVYSLTAVATDTGGISTTSQPVSITVLPGTVPTNLPPVVRITSPPNGSVFRAPVNLPLYAYAADPQDGVTAVAFYAGNNSLGFGQRVAAVPPLLPPGGVQPPILIIASNYWELTWTNATLGTNFPLTAIATAAGGLTATSNPVLISILPAPPPPTNRPPKVSIVATDPVAVEGTNCWTWLGLTNAPPTWSNWVAARATALCRFTNCGPQNATFIVFRRGATNDDLTVGYNVGGTASNGVDYVTIATNVTIAAGQLRAAITIVPLDDGPPDVNQTVILTLTAATNYTLGLPRRAAAVIIDSNGPRPMAGMLPGNCFHLAIPGPNAAWFGIEWSTNMTAWLPVCTNQVINGSIDFVDPDASGCPARFYRAVPLTGPPSD